MRELVRLEGTTSRRAPMVAMGCGMKMKALWLFLTLLTALCVLDSTEASVFAKSTKTECVVQSGEGADLKTKDGNPCKQKLVVALTVTSNDVSQNFIL